MSLYRDVFGSRDKGDYGLRLVDADRLFGSQDGLVRPVVAAADDETPAGLICREVPDIHELSTKPSPLEALRDPL